MTATGNPWDRQTGETARAYAAFLDYCNMGPGRSQRRLQDRYHEQAVAAHESGDQDALPPTTRATTLADWSAKYDWVTRVDAWDRDQAQRVADGWRDKLIQARLQDWDTGQGLRDLAGRLIELAPRLIEKQAESGRLNLGLLVRIAETASKLQRLAVGLPDSHQEISGETQTVITAGDLAEIRAEIDAWERETFSYGPLDGPENA